MLSANLKPFSLCTYFLSGYLSNNDDPTNFPPDQLAQVLDRYEKLFESALRHLGVTKEALRAKSAFKFDSGDAANLEGGVAILRTVELLHQHGFLNIRIIAEANEPRADLLCERDRYKVCLEVKAITKQSSGRPGCFFEEQLYEKILESVNRARKQLVATGAALQCDLTILVCVVNWFAQSIYLCEADYQKIVNKLERDQDQESLAGIDAVVLITSAGKSFCFLNERGKCIDQPSRKVSGNLRSA
jgi:hypothetical protein